MPAPQGLSGRGGALAQLGGVTKTAAGLRRGQPGGVGDDEESGAADLGAVAAGHRGGEVRGHRGQPPPCGFHRFDHREQLAHREGVGVHRAEGLEGGVDGLQGGRGNLATTRTHVRMIDRMTDGKPPELQGCG